MSKCNRFIVALVALFSLSALGAQVPGSKNMGAVIGGYLDAQMQWNHGTLDLSDTSAVVGGIRMPGSGTGFAVHQGAITFSDELEGAELTIDLPFRQLTGSTTTNNFEIATKQAQAFIKYQYDAGMFWQIGQFDSIFGIEPNDTPELILAQHGILHDLNPKTQTGIMFGYSFLPFYVDFSVGNANSAAVQASNSGPQFGAKVGWSLESVQLSLAALYQDTKGKYVITIPPATSESPGYKPIMQLIGTVQTQFKNLELMAEFDLKKSSQGVAGTTTGRKDHEMVMGFLAQGSFKISDKWSAALRYEYLKNDETNEFIQSAQQTTGITNKLSGQGGYLSKISLGAKKMISDELSIKVGADMNSLNIGKDNQAEGKTQGWIQGQLAAVYDF